jgi:hypothetical protein
MRFPGELEEALVHDHEKFQRKRKSKTSNLNLFKFVFWNGNLWCIEIDEEETSNHGE